MGANGQGGRGAKNLLPFPFGNGVGANGQGGRVGNPLLLFSLEVVLAPMVRGVGGNSSLANFQGGWKSFQKNGRTLSPPRSGVGSGDGGGGRVVVLISYFHTGLGNRA